MGSNSAASSGDGGFQKNPTRSTVTKVRKSPVQQVASFIKGGGLGGAFIRGISGAIQKSATKSKQNKMDYEGQAAGVTPMGSPPNFTGSNNGGGNNSNTVVPLATAATAPTTAEVAQATATDATDTTSSEDILLKKKKTKATGRSMTILNKAQGVADQGLTLGKRSLLGS